MPTSSDALATAACRDPSAESAQGRRSQLIAYLLSTRCYTPHMKAAPMLRYARRLAGLTQRQLAERAGVPQATVGRIEAGQITPRVDTLERLLRATGHELKVGGRPGIGVDRSQIRALLRLTPGQRLELVTRDAEGMSRLQPMTKRR